MERDLLQGEKASLVIVREGDLSRSALLEAKRVGLAAVDTETTGLEWSTSALCLVQVCVPGVTTEVIRVRDDNPASNLQELFRSSAVTKLFHHAMFDMRFIRKRWACKMTSVECTKVAAKLLWPNEPERQSLKALTAELLGIRLDKEQQLSDWTAAHLSRQQIEYAANDVLHLTELRSALSGMLEEQGLSELARSCWSHLPTRVELEIRGIPDPFAY